MKSIKDGVVEQLRLQRATEDTIAMWEELWSRLESGGMYSAQDYVAELLEEPGEEDLTVEDA